MKHYFMKFKLHILYTSYIIALLLLTGCREKDDVADKAFDDFTNQLFANEVSSDSLSLNYTLAHPENFGIEPKNTSLGVYSVGEMKESIIESENLLQSLQPFKKEDLSFSQQVLHDTLSLSFSHALKENNFLLFNEILSPTTGMQAQLPVLLCEYHFREKEDIENYFSLLRSIPTYFESILDFEKMRVENSTYMNASTVANIILQCKDFIRNPTKNLMIINFDEKIREISFLTNDEKKSLSQKNKKIVLDSVIKSYQTLILGLESLQDKARNNHGVSSLEQGHEYYKYLIESTTGSFRNIDELWTLLNEMLIDSNTKLHQLAREDPTLFSRSYQLGVHLNTPSSILKTLENAIKKDFPSIKKVNHQVKYVDPSLEKFLSPAFYLTPPLDESSENTIYINGATRFENVDLFPTLAHEGYPGHLYQAVFQNENQSSPLYGVLNFEGYTEGWGTYAELYSYRYAGLDENVSTILQCNTISSLALTSLCDIGIHYKGWSLKDTDRFLSIQGIKDSESCEDLFQSLIDEPASYLKYSIGYLEILELKKKAEKILGKKYSDKKFHTYILSMGPTWFSILDEYMEEWFDRFPEKAND